MNDAIMNTVSVEMIASDFTFRSSGQSIDFPGFMSVYLEDSDEKNEDENEKILPDLKEGDKVQIKEIITNEHHTQPPGRYTEASLIKSLEKEGIGRPSTYAVIIETLKNKEYVEIENRVLMPTGKGMSACSFLSKNFEDFVKYSYTAELEETLDKIARGENEWVPVTDNFFKHMNIMVKKADEMSPEEKKQERILGTDPKSGRTVSVRHGPYGPHAMIGTKDDPKEAGKPKSASLRPGQDIQTVTLNEVLELFILPRELGSTPDGEIVTACLGRFGPYLNYGEKKNLSLRGAEEEGQEPYDPYTITLEEALPLISKKKELDANKIIKDFGEKNIQVLNGRYGPYITDGKKNVKVPKDSEPSELTFEECEELIIKAPVRTRRRFAKKSK